LLTLYNPKRAVLHFQVLCTAPGKCTAFDAEGHLAAISFLFFLLTIMVPEAFLLLVLQGKRGSQLLQVLHVSLGQKLVAAYILGLLTMVPFG
ncbi:hypothetical protein U0070_001692, partial [Myodes glareolus]